MKKIIVLFAILGFAIHAFAQNKLSKSEIQYPPLISVENLPYQIENRGLPTSNTSQDIKSAHVIKHQTIQNRSLIQINDSIYYWDWDITIKGWKLSDKKIMVYDANYNMTSELNQNWNGSTWVFSDQTIYTYDAYNNKTSELSTNCSGIISKNTYTYDANNNMISKVEQNLNDSSWFYTGKFTYTYNANNNMTSETIHTWEDSSWVIYGKSTFTYDVNYNLTSELFQFWKNNSWENYQKDSFTYDDNNNMTITLFQKWIDSNWLNININFNTYDENNKLTSKLVCHQESADSAWVIDWKLIYTYDENNNLVSILHLIKNGSSLVIDGETTYTYDANNFNKSKTYKRWINNRTKVTNGDSTYYFSSTIDCISESLEQNAKIIIYPNPSTGELTITSKRSLNSIEVFSLTGELLYSNYHLNRQTSVDINLISLQKGIYIARIHDENLVLTKKLIIQ